jgi:hypothetical protein
VGPRAGLDAVESRNISCPFRKSNPGRPARIPPLHRVSYPGSNLPTGMDKIFYSLETLEGLGISRRKNYAKYLQFYSHLTLDVSTAKQSSSVVKKCIKIDTVRQAIMGKRVRADISIGCH